MKKSKILLLLSSFLLISACSATPKENSSFSSEISSISSEVLSSEQINSSSEITSSIDVTDLNQNGISLDNQKNIFIITKSGSYTFSGKWNGAILVKAATTDDVNLIFNNFQLNSNYESAIVVESAASLKITAKTGSINDLTNYGKVPGTKSESYFNYKYVVDAKCPITFEGDGTLNIIDNYFGSIHSTSTLLFKNCKINTACYDDAISGEDGINIENSNLYVIAEIGDGIKTKNSGNSKGTILLNNSNVTIYSELDCFESSYDIKVDGGDLKLYSNQYARNQNNYPFSKAYYIHGLPAGTSTASSKGMKAENLIDIVSGNILVQAVDDGIHTNYGTTFKDSTKSLGDIHISGGTISIISGDDALHADNTFLMTGGNIEVVQGHEGIEANFVTIKDGNIKLNCLDDGINGSKKIKKTPLIDIQGGYIDITVKGSDVDGIDSNGSYQQSGGIVITKGCDNELSSGLDVDGGATVSGGSFICFGEPQNPPTPMGNIKSNIITGSFAIGEHTITIGSNSYKTTTIFRYSEIYTYGTQEIKVS